MSADAFIVPVIVAEDVVDDAINAESAPLPTRSEFTVDIAVIIALIEGVDKAVEFVFMVDDNVPVAVKLEETVELPFIVDDN